MTRGSKKSLAVQVAENLKEEIISRQLKPGDKLPSESELIQKFDVSRTTIREAMKLLKAENVIVIQRGNGTFVSDKTGVTHDPLGLHFSEQSGLLEDLLEARILIEPELVVLAALRATKKDIDELESIIERMKKTTVHDEEYTKLDVEFHTKIANCAHNDVLQKVVPIICESICEGYQETVYATGSFERALTSHINIFNAIAKKDVLWARYEMERHIRQTLGDVKKEETK